MNSLVEILKPLVIAALAAVLGGFGTGCAQVRANSEPTTSDVYTLRIIACAVKAESKEEAVECRRRANREFGLCGPDSDIQPC